MTVESYHDYFFQHEQVFFSYLAAAVLEAEGPVRRHHLEARLKAGEIHWLEKAILKPMQARLQANELIRTGLDAEGRFTYDLTRQGRTFYAKLRTYYDSNVVLSKPGPRSRPSALAERACPC